jgi:hypothetical protein
VLESSSRTLTLTRSQDGWKRGSARHMSSLTDKWSVAKTSARTPVPQAKAAKFAIVRSVRVNSRATSDPAWRRNHLHRRRTPSRHRKTLRSDGGAVRPTRSGGRALFHLSGIPATKTNSPPRGSASWRIPIPRGEFRLRSAVRSPQPTTRTCRPSGLRAHPRPPARVWCAA